MKRYILINDNKIIDTNEYEIAQEKCLNGFVHFHKKGNKYNTFSYMFRVTDIIKEADSKFDLLEKGDLVEFKSTRSGKNIIQIFEKQEDEKYYFSDNSYCTKNPIAEFEKDPLNPSLDKPDLMIVKIYKPNNNKGYDLAWEREEE